MAFHNEIGNKGEDAAAQLLQKKGYKIVERNWHSGRLEIDIIAQNKQNIVFVEVKTRTTFFNDKRPEEYVDRAKQAHVTHAANNYIAYHRITLQPRFDIVSVLLDQQTLEIAEIEHIENAFDPPLRTVGGYNPLYRKKRTWF